jgi:hypothetical protein
MLLYENRSPRAFFGPPFPPRKIFDTLEKTMGPYQGLFYQNKRLVLHSPTLKGIWKQVGIERSLDDFLDHLSRHVTVGERSHLKEFLEKAAHLDSQIADRFILVPNTMGDFLFLGITLTPTPFGTHMSLSPASDLKECVALQGSINPEKLPSLFSALANWFEEAETEELITLAINLLPRDLILSLHIHRINSYVGVEKEKRSAHLFYENRGEKWIRNIFDSEETSGYIPTMRLQAYTEGVDVMMRSPMFIGQVLPLFWVSINHQKLNQFGIPRFSSYLREFSMQSVLNAQRFQNPKFRFSQYWSGQGYSTDGLLPIARIISVKDPQEAGKIPVLPIWGLSQATLPGLQKAHRIPDPLFLDWNKGLGIIMLRDCSLEQARAVVWKNLKSRIKLPTDEPMTLLDFLKLE